MQYYKLFTKKSFINITSIEDLISKVYPDIVFEGLYVESVKK